MEFDINDVAQIGSVADVPGYMLPPEAWTLALNMRYADEGIQALDGWVQTFGTPIHPPHFTFPITTSTGVLWPYVGLTAASMWNGATHNNITPPGGLHATDTYQWNGTMLGEVLVLNNGIDQPMVWLPPYSGTILAPMPNFSGFAQANPPPGWSSGNITRTAKVIRAFGSFLIAVDITSNDVTGIQTNHPHRVLWSHPAPPGEVPPSWDITDTTKDTGQLDLPDVTAGILMDALPLGSTMYLYKEASIWKMRFVGGQSIFDIGQSSWITTAGLLGQRCVCVTGDGTKHVLATQDDIIWHNGNNVQSILNKRQRRRLQNEIDTVNFFQSFIFPNPFNNEVWFCYPSSGNTYPNKALILNYKTAGGTDWVITEADGITFRNAAVGTIETPDFEQWNQGTDTWDQFTGPWSVRERRRVVLCDPTASKFYNFGVGTTRDGVAFETTLRREGLALIGKKRNGDPIVDHRRMKLFTRAWPKIITAATGNMINVRFGGQQTVDGPVAWGSYKSFNPAFTTYADPGPVSGRAVGIEFTATGILWRMDGYKVDMSPMGEY